MKLERINDVLKLDIGDGHCVSFIEDWVEKLRALPYDEFGEFIRTTIYPALSSQEKKLWNRSQISNRDLFTAIQSVV